MVNGTNEKQAVAYGTRIIDDYVLEVDFDKKIHCVKTEKDKLSSHTVIIILPLAQSKMAKY